MTKKTPAWAVKIQEHARKQCLDPETRQRIREFLLLLVRIGKPEHTRRTALVKAVRVNVWGPFNPAKGDSFADKVRCDAIAQILDSLVLEGEITEYKESTHQHPVRRYRIDAPSSDR